MIKLHVFLKLSDFRKNDLIFKKTITTAANKIQSHLSIIYPKTSLYLLSSGWEV